MKKNDSLTSSIQSIHFQKTNMKNSGTSRRAFILNSGKAGLALGLGISAAGCGSTKKATGKGPSILFDQSPLPYGYNALEPAIDATTMEIHYSKHAATYSKNLKDAAQAEGVGTGIPLEELLTKVSKYSAKMRNNAGGHYNHELFWRSMRPKTEFNKPSGKLLTDIETTFTSFDNFKTLFSDAGRNRFGSGWAWLIQGADKKLKIGSTPNQDNPLMDVSDLKGSPLLGLDVWEHAYYLKYQNRRPDYIENWWALVNWDFVQKLYENVA
jgi:Fe-Mn family superoxide dismutase